MRLRMSIAALCGLSHLTNGFILTPYINNGCPVKASHPEGAQRRSVHGMMATTSKPPEGVQTAGDGGNTDACDYIAAEFEQIYNRALNGKPAQLKALFGSTGKWGGIPLADNKSGDIQEAIDVIDQGRSFMIDPRVTVTGSKIDRNANKVILDWQLSGTWPFPYRPRVRAAGTWTFTIDASRRGPEGAPMLKSLEEKWDHEWWRTALEQASPRGWDLWHLYLTPPAEKPLYRVVKKFPALEIREYYPRLVIELESYDARPDVRFTEFAWILPDFAFTDELKLQGKAQYRETYVTTSPIETCVESVSWTKGEGRGAMTMPAKRIRWHVPVPSHLGHDVSTLPIPEKKPDQEYGEAGKYVLQPRRFMAVRTYKGQTQTENYATARRWLLSWCQKEGLRTVKNEVGKSRVWVQAHNMKAGFNMAGSFCLGIYEQPSYSDWGEIAVEVEEPPLDG